MNQQTQDEELYGEHRRLEFLAEHFGEAPYDTAQHIVSRVILEMWNTPSPTRYQCREWAKELEKYMAEACGGKVSDD